MTSAQQWLKAQRISYNNYWFLSIVESLFTLHRTILLFSSNQPPPPSFPRSFLSLQPASFLAFCCLALLQPLLLVRPSSLCRSSSSPSSSRTNEKAERSDIPYIDKKKYLVPADLTVGQFVYIIRKRIKLSAEKTIFIFVDNVLPPTGTIRSTIYDQKKDEDGFLYVTYSGENTFG
ncbi:uncharacterized protein LOC118344158 [Juglans regia]|uniref:Autophagy-related protein n=1 Tax=Juglans regia TaxID=51240 RepID=A0A6P9EB22_JUGRE|nr:uncharacterized protein LOC118344158 [Juglans regia]